MAFKFSGGLPIDNFPAKAISHIDGINDIALINGIAFIGNGHRRSEMADQAEEGGVLRRTSQWVSQTIILDDRTTSVRMEPEFWSALKEVARQQRTSRVGIIREIDRERGSRPLSQAIRVWTLEYFRKPPVISPAKLVGPKKPTKRRLYPRRQF